MSKKNLLLTTIANVVENTEENGDLVLYTSLGIIKGKPVKATESESDKMLDVTVSNFEKQYKEAKPNSVEENGYIVIKNGKLINSGLNVDFASMVVFFDQIIAASIEK